MASLGPLALIALLAMTGATAACAKAQARTEPEMPPLEVPPPPPRVIAPLEVEPAAPPASAPEEGAARQPGTRSTARPAPARPENSPARPAETAKPETPAKVDQTAEAARPVVEEAPPARTLQTVPPGGDAGEERAIRALLARAARYLSRVDYRGLSAERKSQYDTAKRFSEQAEEALRAKNFVFARKLADKAEELAAVLVGQR